MVVEVMAEHHLSQRRACGLIGITRRALHRVSAEDRNRELRQRLRALAEERRRWGCPMLYRVIRREGFRVNISVSNDCTAKKGCRCADGADASC